VRDHLLSQSLSAVYDCSEIEHGEAHSTLVVLTDAEERTAREKKLATLWAFLRNHLSEDIYKKTLDPQLVSFGSCVGLLRFLRKNWHNNSVFDRSNIREDFKALTLETCKDMDDFIMNFKSCKALMGKHGIGIIETDEDALFALHEKLPVAYKENRLHVMANAMSYEDALAYYANVAKCFSDVPGSTHPSVSNRPESVHNAVEVCRMFASNGHCRFGNKCKFTHVGQPSGKANNTQSANRFNGKCNYCGIKGHKERECRKKKTAQGSGSSKETAAAAKEAAKADANMNTVDTEKIIAKIAAKMVALPQTGAAADVNNAAANLTDLSDLHWGTVDHPIESVGPDIVAAIRNGFTTPLTNSGELRMLVDGGATSVIVQDSGKLQNLRPAHIPIKVGGGMVTCTQVGDFYYATKAHGKMVVNRAVARHVPNFGFDVLPEAIYLAAGASMIKGKSKLEAKQGQHVLLEAEKHPHCWLYFAKITPISRPPSGTPLLTPLAPKQKSSESAPRYTSNVIQDCSEVASFALGHAYPSNVELSFIAVDPLIEGLSDDVSKGADISLVARSQSISQDELLLWHRKMGHRNYKDVCTLLGIPLPAKLPVCTTCILSKSKRHPLGRRSTPLYEAPRPGYSWSCDFAGPFRCRTAGGNTYLSVKVDNNSKLIAARMAKSPSEFTDEFIDFVHELEAAAGHSHVVAQLVMDSASYYKWNKALREFCRKRGIIQLFSPPYTQSLNGLAERTIALLVEMAVAMLIDSGLPRSFYGEALMYAAYLLNRLPYAAGTRITRLEMFKQKLLPNQHSRTHTFGCAAYKHLVHPTGPNVDKLDAKSKLCIFVGVEKNSNSYRLIEPVHFAKVPSSAHCIFVEDMFPAKKNANINVDQHNFTPIGWDARPELNQEAPAPVPIPLQRSDFDGAPRRSNRAWAPSGGALRNLAEGPPAPPPPSSSFEEKHDSDAGMAATDFYYEVVFAHDSPTVSEALNGPAKQKWTEALISEVKSHEKNQTLGPALSQIPPGFTAIPLDIVTKLKRDGRHKMRAIIKGYLMTMGMHYNQTFAPVPQISTFRFFLALATQLDWEAWQGDYETAFLGADMDTELYAKVPKWFSTNPDASDTGFTYHRVLKAIPGCPQGPRLFHKKSHSVYTKKMALIQSKLEYTLYYDKENQLFLLVWVDDIFLFFPSKSMEHATKLWKGLQTEFCLADAEDISDCLGCVITRDRPNRRMFLSQSAAATKLLEKSGLGLAEPADTPLVPNTKLSSADCPTDAERLVMADQRSWYLSNAASLIYLSQWTRPDIAYAVSKLCRFMHNPSKTHTTALKRTLRYLKGTVNHGLLFDFSNTRSCKLGVYGLYDASHADCPDTLKSTMAFLFFLAGCIISWHTKLHTYVTTSTNHSEYCAAAKASREAKWFHMLATSIGFAHLASPVNLFSDSKGAIAMTHNPVQRSASKHVDLADHYARECQERGITTVSYMSTKEMTADNLTKSLPRTPYEKHRTGSCVMPRPAWA